MSANGKNFSDESAYLKDLVEKDQIESLFDKLQKYTVPELYIMEAVKANDNDSHAYRLKQFIIAAVKIKMSASEEGKYRLSIGISILALVISVLSIFFKQ